MMRASLRKLDSFGDGFECVVFRAPQYLAYLASETDGVRVWHHQPQAPQTTVGPMEFARRAALTIFALILVAAPLATEGQPKVWRIGLLVPGRPPGCDIDSQPAVSRALRDALRELGTSRCKTTFSSPGVQSAKVRRCPLTTAITPLRESELGRRHSTTDRP